MKHFHFVTLPNLTYTPDPKPPKKQPVRGYCATRKNHTIIPDHVVAGIKWLHAQGFSPRMVAKFYPGMPPSYYDQVTQGICRLYVEPAPPVFIDAAGWASRYRWPSKTESTTVEE